MCFFALNLWVQHRAGARNLIFAGYPDSPSHFLSGLMIHDYIRSGFHRPPLAYAMDYYLRLPYLAVGYWPPAFYVIEAAWMLCFGVSCASVLWLLAAFTAALSLAIFTEVRRQVNFAGGLAAGLLFTLLPVVAWGNSRVMVDTAVALFGFLATMACADYLDEGGTSNALRFGVWSAASVLTKLSGAYAILLLPAGILLRRRFSLLAHRNTWLAFAPAAVLIVPWFAATHRLVSIGLPVQPFSLAHTIENLSRAAAATPAAMAMPAWALLACLAVWLPGGKTAPTRRMLLFLQPLAVVANMAASPVTFESRYLLPALPALVVLLVAGTHRLSRWMGGPRPRLVQAVFGLSMLAVLLVSGRQTIQQEPALDAGLPQAADSVLAQPDARRTSILVSASSGTEGEMIAEIGMRDSPGPGVRLLRGNRTLASTDWFSEKYKLKYDNPAAVLQFLEVSCVGLVLADLRPANLAHHRLLLETLEQHPNRWQIVGEYPAAEPRYALFHGSHPSVGDCRSPGDMQEEELRRLLQSGHR